MPNFTNYERNANEGIKYFFYKDWEQWKRLLSELARVKRTGTLFTFGGNTYYHSYEEW